MRRRGVAAITTIVCAITLVIGLVASGWTPKNAKNSVMPSDEDIAWHDYTEPGVVANGNRMPDGTVLNPWEATDGLQGNDRFKAIMSELRARVNPDDKLKRPSAALLAELAFDARERLGFDILGKHKDVNDPNVIQEYFMHDPAYAREVYAKLDTIWRGAMDGEIIKDYSYVSAFYMEHDAITIDGKPAPKVVAAESSLTGGHFVRLKVRNSEGRIVDLVYRLECGFQPVNITVPTNHEPVVDNPSSPSHDPSPGPGPELEPKNPDDGPTGRHQDNPDPDSGGGPNDEKETHHDETEEPDTDNSPSEYKAPDPPKADEGGNSGGGNSGGGNSGGGNSGGSEKKAKDDNGKQETYKDPDSGKESSGTVRTGDSEEYNHRDEKVDKNPSKVEKGVNPDPPKKESGGSNKESGGSNKESSGGSDKGSDNKDSGGSNEEEIVAPE